MEYIVLLVGLGLLAFYLIALYNRLIALQQTRKNSFSDIDVQLKLRHDLIPNLVESVSSYLQHEKEVLENVTSARSNAMKASSIEEKSAAESSLDSALMKLYAVSEAYPELKADNTFNRFQAEIAAVERTIAAARRFFNNATAEFNTATMQFPSNIFAKIFSFHEESYFELSAEQKAETEKPFKIKF